MSHLGNLLLDTDSYKASHWLQYPPGTDATFFYVESRGGEYERTLFFGLQARGGASLVAAQRSGCGSRSTARARRVRKTVERRAHRNTRERMSGRL